MYQRECNGNAVDADMKAHLGDFATRHFFKGILLFSLLC